MTFRYKGRLDGPDGPVIEWLDSALDTLDGPGHALLTRKTAAYGIVSNGRWYAGWRLYEVEWKQAP